MSTATAVGPMTIHEAAENTGWSARMLRYVERVGLVAPARSSSGYRLYGPRELRRLMSLRELLLGFELELGDIAFARRMSREADLREAIENWLTSELASENELMTTTTEAA